MRAVLFARFSHPAVLKKSLALLAVLALAAGHGRAANPASGAIAPVVTTPPVGATNHVIVSGPVAAASPVSAGAPEVAGWKPLPLEVRRDVDAFFMNLELAINYNRLDLVMALYTPDAVEVKADGGRFVFAGIRQRRQEEMDSFTKSGVKPATVQRNYLLYKPGGTPGEFSVKYPVRTVGPGSGTHPAIDNIVYVFRRSAGGLQLSAMVIHAVEGMSPSDSPLKPAPSQVVNLAPDLDGPTPTEIRLTNGVKLRQVKVLHWQPDSVLIQYVGGTVPIRLVNIHPDDRAYFTANMDRQLQAQKDAALNAARNSAMQAQMENNAARGQAEFAAQQEDMQSNRDAQIDEAISHHRLMVGMTSSQVSRSWGPPTRINQVDTSMGHTILWTYGGRGVNEHGVVIDAAVAFIDDHVEILLNLRAKDRG